MDLQPTLTGETLELRPLLPAHWEALYGVARDPLIWEQHPKSDRWKEDVFRAFFDVALTSKGAFAIFERATGQVAGSSRYLGFDPVKREVEIGFTFLARRLWGGAANRELKSLMLAHAFRFVDCVYFLVDEKNTRSRRAMEKIGGRLAETFPRDGRLVVRYDLTKPA